MLEIVSESAVKKILTRELAFNAIEAAFEAVANGNTEIFKVAMGKGIYDSDVFAIKSAADSANKLVGFKVGSYWPNNGKHNLPSHSATTLLLEPDTGVVKTLVNASLLNGYRTAAANAVATKHLARTNAKVLGVIGAGHQAEHEIRALMNVREFELVKVATREESRGNWLIGRLSDLDVQIELTDFKNATIDSDVLVTVTSSTQPIVQTDWVSKGTHISAMGADMPGKIELDPSLLKNATLFADLPAQSITLGEFEKAYTDQILQSASQITPIGLVTQNIASGRRNDDEITVFDSSGLAAQDIVIASIIAEQARQKSLIDVCNL